MEEPPENRCVTHRPPQEGKAWRRPEGGMKVCWGCHDRLLDWLVEIPQRYAALDATPGTGAENARRGPGFASQPAANLHIVALRDFRTVQTTPGGVQSVPGILSSWVQLLAEERELEHVPSGVVGWADLLRAHLEWICSQDWVDEFKAEIGELRSQLRTATGEPKPAVVGTCTQIVDDDLTRCGAPLRAPGKDAVLPSGTVLRCGRCHATYSGMDLVRVRLTNESEAS